MSKSIYDEARGRVKKIIDPICAPDTDAGEYEKVLRALTDLAILGTLPAGCRSKPVATKKVHVESEDFSYSKERWIGS